jgi:hypothetical protein
MIRRILLAAVLGGLVGFTALRLGAAGSPIQAILVGVLSAMGFMTASVMARGRVRGRQGEAPELLPGETARLYGPVEVVDAGGASKAWAYVSNRRLMLRDASGSKADLALSDIEELRPPQAGLFSGQVSLVAKGRGLLTLKVPDAKRWHAAIHGALHPG